LFAALAVQLKGFPIEAVEEAAFTADAQLADILIRDNSLTPEETALIEALVDEIIAAYGGVASALSAFAGLARIVNFQQPLAECSTLEAAFLPTAPEEVVFSAVDETPGRYKFISRYARGGMGQILLVRDEYLGRTVALKEFLHKSRPPSVLNQADYSAKVTARFLQEARITGQLEHPSIVPVYELGRRHDGTPYFTMKLVKGRTLSEALKACKSFSERIQFLTHLVDVCQAVAYAHSRGVVHRDIKPDNIMVGDFGETIVLDWGLAKARGTVDFTAADAGEDERLTAAGPNGECKTAYGRALGTPNYMSPEQAKGQIESVDERSDVYSLGAVLYEILTGLPPHAGRTREEVMLNVIHSVPKPILQAVPEAPPELAGICEKALQVEPHARYQSAVALAEDVQRFVTGRLVLAYHYSVRGVLAHYYRKHKVVVNLVLICSMLVTAILAYAYISVFQARNNEHRQRVVAEQATAKETRSREHAERVGFISKLALTQQYLAVQNYEMAKEVLWSVPENQHGWEWGFLLNQANPDLITVSTSPFKTTSVAVSPRGGVVAATSNEGPVQLWDLQTGTLLRNCEGKPFMLSLPCQFSPDGELLLGAGLDAKIRIWAVSSGKCLCELSGHSKPVLYADFGSDGTEVVSASQDGTVKTWEIPSGTSKTLLETSEGFTKAILSPDSKLLCTVSEREEVRLWRREETLVEQSRWPGRDTVFSPSGQFLAIVAEDGTVSIFDCRSDAKVFQFEHTAQVSGADFNESSDLLLTASSDGYARLWDLNSGELFDEYFHGKPLLKAAFLQNASLIVTCSLLNDFVVWDVKTAAVVNSMSGSGPSVSNVDFSANGDYMVTACNKDFFQVWNPSHRTGRRLLNFGGASYPALAVSEQGGRIATLDVVNGLQVIDLNNPSRHTAYAGNPMFFGGDRGVTITEDGSKIGVILDLFVPMVLNRNENKYVQLFGHNAGIQSIAFDVSGQKVVTSSVDTTVRIWESDSGQQLVVLNGHTNAVWSAAFSPDARKLVTASRDGTARVWDAESGRQLLQLKGHLRGIRCAEFSPDGSRILTSGDDRTVRIWDAGTGAPIGLLKGHSDSVYSVTQVDQVILTSSSDGTSRVWDATDLQTLLVLPGVCSFRYTAKGLVAAFHDGRTEILEIPGQNEAGHQVSLTPETFANYRTTDHSAAVAGGIPSVLPGTMTTVSSIDTVKDCLRNLLKQLDSHSGVAKDSGLKAEALRPLGLQKEDIVVECCGAEISQIAQFAAAISSALASMSRSEMSCQVDFVVSRGQERVPVRVVAEACRRLSRTASLTPDHAAAVLGLIMETDDNGAAEMPQGVNRYQASRGEVENGQDSQGRQFDVYLPDDASLEKLLEAQLSPFDIIVAIDGHKLGKKTEDAVWLKDLIAQVVAGEKKEYTLDIRRGEFIQLTVVHSIKR